MSEVSDLISIYVSLPDGRNKRKETLVQVDNRKFIKSLKDSNKTLVRSDSEDESDFEEDGYIYFSISITEDEDIATTRSSLRKTLTNQDIQLLVSGSDPLKTASRRSNDRVEEGELEEEEEVDEVEDMEGVVGDREDVAESENDEENREIIAKAERREEIADAEREDVAEQIGRR